MEITVEGKEYRLAFDYNPALVDDIRQSFEGRRYEKSEKCWYAPITPRNNWLVKYELHWNTDKNPYNRYKKIPLDIEGTEKRVLTLDLKVTLYKRQIRMLAHMLARDRCLNAADMRMGKTLPFLVLVLLLGLKKPWFVSTDSAISGIRKEMRKWQIKISIILMTYDAFTSIMNDDPKCVPDCIAYDEMHYLKDPGSNRTKAASMATFMMQIKYGDKYRIFGLSGTPSPKKPIEWWSLLEILQPGWFLQSSITLFQEYLAEVEWKENPYGGKYPKVVRWHRDRVEKIGEKMRGMVEVFKKEDYSRLKEPDFEIVELPVNAEVVSSLETLALLLDDKNMYWAYRQLADGFMYDSYIDDAVTLKKNRKAILFHTEKDEQFKLDLDEHEEIGRLIVYGYFTHTVDKLCDIAIERDWHVLKITGNGKEALNTNWTVEHLEDAMDASMDNKQVKKVITILQSDIVEGLELSASPTIIFYSNTLVGGKRKQGEARFNSENSPWTRLLVKDYGYLDIDYEIIKRNKEDDVTQNIPQNVLRESIKKTMELPIKTECNLTPPC